MVGYFSQLTHWEDTLTMLADEYDNEFLDEFAQYFIKSLPTDFVEKYNKYIWKRYIDSSLRDSIVRMQLKTMPSSFVDIHLLEQDVLLHTLPQDMLTKVYKWLEIHKIGIDKRQIYA